ncbi:MAG: hypothetical protein K6T78_12235 [Alicyclobacillus sp.]|nr:hypothetical protein [Alicyclobacillus sp.]
MATTPMTITTANIIIGPCTSFTVDGNPVGATSGGVTFEKKQTYTDLSIDQITGIAKKAIKEETYTVTTTLAEATLQNLQYALSLSAAPVVSTSPATTTLNLGLESGAVEHKLVFVGPCPPSSSNYKTRTFTLNRAINVSAVKMEIAKDKEQMYQVSFECLPDLTQPAGSEYGTIVDQ